MIFVDRAAAPNPFLVHRFLGERAVAERNEAEALIDAGLTRQRRLEFKAYRHEAVRQALTDMFSGKCAYCETLLGATGPADVEQFRPKSGVVEAREHPGYWWLANEWSNLLIACVDCNRQRRQSVGLDGSVERTGKQNRFPLKYEGDRAYGPGDDISAEAPLILDPTIDNPLDHLLYADTGEILSETERGHATIAVLGLNRSDLIKQRQLILRHYKSLLELALRIVGNASSESDMEVVRRTIREITEMGAPGAQYAGLIRQHLVRDLPQFEARPGLPQMSRDLLPDPGSEDAPLPVTKARQKRAVRAIKSYRAQMQDYTLGTETGNRTYRAQRRTIETISLHNIRAIRSLDIDLTRLGGGSWLMLLGENGTGKSTILQAIALVLAGPEYAARLIEDGDLYIAEFLRLRTKSGGIKVKLSGFAEPHRMQVFADRLEFASPGHETVIVPAGGGWDKVGFDAQIVLAGYGATRMPPRARDKTGPSRGSFARIDNLFDPFTPLIDTTSWLLSLDSSQFDRVAIVLKDLMSIDAEALLERKDNRIWVRSGGAKVPLGSLSVGYQTVISAAVDILEILSRIWEDPTQAEGIVLIDELDAHLHPAWQMRIVGSLRKAFAGVQFITTTHQPLCLRGLGAGEVIVVRRGADRQVEFITDLPSPADFRVDQLLTSPFFGLNSTSDPETEILFDRYYALLALETRNAAQQTELISLARDLEGRRHFGETQREALYYAAIDKILAREKTADTNASLEEVREEAVADISAIWEGLMADPATNGGVRA